MISAASPALEFLSPREAAARWTTAPIAFVPIGPLEFHGAHLPIGLDPLVAQGVCVRVAERTGGLVLPPLWHGTGGEHGAYPFSLMAPAAALGPLLAHTIDALCRWDARVIVLFTGHMTAEQRELIAALAREKGEPNHQILALSAVDWKENPMQPDHAAIFETTLLGALYPELVHIERLPRDPLPPEPTAFGPQRHDPAHPLHGIFGPDPRAYDPATSSALLDGLVAWLTLHVNAARPGRG